MLSSALTLHQDPAPAHTTGRTLAVLTALETRHFFPGPLFERLQGLSSELIIINPEENGGIDLARELERVQPAVLLACWKTPRLPDRIPSSLRYVCYLCGSVRHLVSRDHLENGLVVTNWGGSIARTVAECALLHALAGLRQATHWALAMHHQGAWKNERTETASLFGRRVGIHGFGRIARELTRLLAPFGCEITVHAPDLDRATESEFGVSSAATLEELIKTSDVFFELAPLNASTRGVIGEKHLRLLRPGSVFVNVGRGALVDEDALVRVAREGRVQFGLDVFSTEPLPANHPLRELANVTLTPHIGGPTTDRRRDAGVFALNNLRAYAAGRPLEAVITPAIFDQST